MRSVFTAATESKRYLYSKAVEFWSKPRCRQKSPNDTPHVHEDWVELLGDLIIVAAFVNLGTCLAYGGPQVLFPIVVMFLAVVKAPDVMSQYINRFECRGLVHLLVFSVVLFGTFMMALSINDTTHHGHQEWYMPREYVMTFMLGFAVSRFGLIVLMLMAAVCAPAARRAQGLQAVCFSISLCGAVFGTCFLEESEIAVGIVYAACILMEMVSTEIFMFSPTKWVKANGFAWPNLAHASARTGIAAMISLGEAVLQILIADFSPESFQIHVRFALLAFMICYCIAMQFFDAQPDAHEYQRMRKKYKRRDIIARIVQPVLLFSLFLVGVSFKVLLAVILKTVQKDDSSSDSHASEQRDGHHRLLGSSELHLSAERWYENMSDACFLFAVSICVCQLLLIFVRLLRDGFRRSVKTRRGRAKLTVRLLFALAHAAIGCISVLSEVFGSLDYGVGSVECHLFLLAPEILMHLVDKKGDFADSDDGDSDDIANLHDLESCRPEEEVKV